jgi:O-antigen/teichoic acid export membrane protein
MEHCSRANGNLRQLNGMAFFGLGLNLLLNFILIPLYKAEGAAIATLITQWLTALIQVIMVYKILKLNVNLKLAATLVVLASFVAGTYFATQALDFSFSMAIITVFSNWNYRRIFSKTVKSF